jgi:hypothetical protein
VGRLPRTYDQELGRDDVVPETWDGHVVWKFGDLPGEGNILVFDNGGAAGFGPPNPGAPTGAWNALKDYSRVLEIDPLTLEIAWQYTARTAGYVAFAEDAKFYSHFKGAATRHAGATSGDSSRQCSILNRAGRFLMDQEEKTRRHHHEERMAAEARCLRGG